MPYRGTLRFSNSQQGKDHGVQHGLDSNDDKKAKIALFAFVTIFSCVALARSDMNAVEFFRNLDIMSEIKSIDETIEGLGPLGYLAFALCYIVLEILALPAVPLTASAGYLFGPVWGTVTVLFSATIAAGISFLIGRTFLRKYVEEITADNKLFQAVDASVGREGFKVVLLLRLSPLLPFALSNYLYGTTSVEFWPYLLATFLGFAPGTLAYVCSGDIAKVLTDNEGTSAFVSEKQWLLYAGALAFLVALSKLLSDIASDALASMEE